MKKCLALAIIQMSHLYLARKSQQTTPVLTLEQIQPINRVVIFFLAIDPGMLLGISKERWINLLIICVVAIRIRKICSVGVLKIIMERVAHTERLRLMEQRYVLLRLPHMVAMVVVIYLGTIILIYRGIILLIYLGTILTIYMVLRCFLLKQNFLSSKNSH